MSSEESHLGLLDRVVCSAQKLCEGKLSCLERRTKVRALCVYSMRFMCLLYEMDQPMNEYLHNLTVARNTRVSVDLGELPLVIPRCRINQFSRSFLPAAVRQWKLVSSFKSLTNLCLLRSLLYFFLFYFRPVLLFNSLLGAMVLRPFWFMWASLFLVICAR